MTLNRASVCGVSSTDTKLHLSTQLFTEKNGDEDSESDEDESKGETEAEKKQREFEESNAIAAPNSRASRRAQKQQQDLEEVMKKFEEEKKRQQSIGGELMAMPGAQPIELNEHNTVFRPIKGTLDTIVCNPLTLKTKSSMNYVFLPVKENNEVI